MTSPQSPTGPYPFRFGVVSDEMDADPSRAFAVAHELGMTDVELNQVGEKNVTDLTTDEMRHTRELLDQNSLRVCVIGTPCFKSVLLDDAKPHRVRGFGPLEDHLKILRRAIECAHQFECPLIRIFSFRKGGMAGLGNPSERLPGGGEVPIDDLHRITEALRIAGDEAMKGGVTLAIENVRSCWGNSGENVARISDAINHPCVRILWDPGNAHVSGGIAFPDGYYAVRKHMVHIHVKDARVLDEQTGLTSWEAIGQGEVDYSAQMRALLDDRYDGVVSLETHWRGENMSREESSRESYRGLLSALQRLS